MSTPPNPSGGRRATTLTIIVAVVVGAIFLLNTNLLGVLMPDLVATETPAVTGQAASDAAVTDTAQPAATEATASEPTASESQGSQAAVTPLAAQPTPTMPDRIEGVPTVAYAALPLEAKQTMALVEAGGPFPYDRDGVVFENREGLLPGRPKGYYREYTVVTPGSDDRGARRIVQGAQNEIYYTDDHYDSFSRVVGQ